MAPVSNPQNPQQQPHPMMMMKKLLANANVDSEWVEFMMPRMMQFIPQMMQEYKQNKQRVRKQNVFFENSAKKNWYNF